MEHQPSLFPNYTMFIQMGIFFAAWTILHFLVVRPYSALFHRRFEATEGLRERARAAQERTIKLKTEYEEFMRQQRLKINAWIDDERRKIADENKRLTQETRNDIAELFQKTQSEIRAEMEKTKKELLPRISEFSSEIVNKLVGNKIKLTISKDLSGLSGTEPVAAG